MTAGGAEVAEPSSKYATVWLLTRKRDLDAGAGEKRAAPRAGGDDRGLRAPGDGPGPNDDLIVGGLEEIHRLLARKAPLLRSRARLQQGPERTVGPDHSRVGLMEQRSSRPAPRTPKRRSASAGSRSSASTPAAPKHRQLAFGEPPGGQDARREENAARRSGPRSRASSRRREGPSPGTPRPGRPPERKIRALPLLAPLGVPSGSRSSSATRAPLRGEPRGRPRPRRPRPR